MDTSDAASVVQDNDINMDLNHDSNISEVSPIMDTTAVASIVPGNDINMDENNVIVSYKPFGKPYAHAVGHKLLFGKGGNLKKTDKVKNWLYPGAAERHSGLSGTEIQEPPEKLLCLLFAPMASLYYRISHTLVHRIRLAKSKRLGFVRSF